MPPGASQSPGHGLRVVVPAVQDVYVNSVSVKRGRHEKQQEKKSTHCGNLQPGNKATTMPPFAGIRSCWLSAPCVASIAKTDVLLEENTFYTRRCTHYEIKRYQNYEIDDIYNFLCVEAVMKHEWGMV